MSRTEIVITERGLGLADQHWALKAIGKAGVKRAREVAEFRTMCSAIGDQMSICFNELPSDSEQLGRVAVAYEIAAIEGLRALVAPTENEENTR